MHNQLWQLLPIKATTIFTVALTPTVATTVSIDATHIFGCHNTKISQRINTLVAIKPTIATKYVVLPENLVL
jgi:hypothetical protein